MATIREVVVHMSVGEPTEDPTLCPACNHFTRCEFPLHGISSEGVSDWGSITACIACYEQDNPDDEE